MLTIQPNLEKMKFDNSVKEARVKYAMRMYFESLSDRGGFGEFADFLWDSSVVKIKRIINIFCTLIIYKSDLKNWNKIKNNKILLKFF